jgi:MFS family permease
MKNKKLFIIGLIGNVLDHYDTALMIYLGSIMAPIFFKGDNNTSSLVMFYGVLSLSVFSRPLGSLIFSKIANKSSPSRSLIISLTGTAFATFFMGFLPSYDSWGLSATILFCTIRFIQTFFGAGEHAVSLLFLMENAQEDSRSNIGAFFNCSTMIGISLASFASYLVNLSSNPLLYWRIPYFLGIITALVGLVLRLITYDKKLPQLYFKENIKKISFLRVIKNNLKEILVISILYIFSMMTYYIPFAFMNDYISIIHPNFSKSQLLFHNTIFLYYDLALLILIGILFKNINYRKMILLSSASLLIFALPAFLLLQINSILIIESVRFIIITIGVMFCASFQAYIYRICNPEYRYIIHGTGIVIGQDFIGRLTLSICLFLFHQFNSPIAPSFYIIFISFIALISVLLYKIQLHEKNNNQI